MNNSQILILSISKLYKNADIETKKKVGLMLMGVTKLERIVLNGYTKCGESHTR